ncbi:MAG: 2OG-Fe(II) oxygenase [Myxococcales bacterium]|nr:2OG-Fe(II) oxygenase [Myxococcales bacterium]
MSLAWPPLDDLAKARRRYQGGLPFPYLVIDDWLPTETAHRLREAIAEEPAERIVSSIYEVDATTGWETVALRELEAWLGSTEVLEAVGTLTGHGLSRVSLRGYAFGPGHYLLPHHDRDRDASRLVAFAYYLAVERPLSGGELELFACDPGSPETPSVRKIDPRPNRLVLFEVSDASLHQVREVTQGLRVSLSGWFYA